MDTISSTGDRNSDGNNKHNILSIIDINNISKCISLGNNDKNYILQYIWIDK